MPAHEMIGHNVENVLASRWTPWVVNLAALALLIFGLSQWTWRLLADPAKSAPSTPPPSLTSQTSINVQSLVEASIFGRPPAIVGGAVDPNQLPVSSLNIVLTGVMAHGGKLGQAIVVVNGQPEMAVAIGGELTPGATLQAIYADRIVLQRGQSLEMVPLHEDDSAKLPAGSIVHSQTQSPAMRQADMRSPVQNLGRGNYNVNVQGLTKQMTPEALQQATVAPSPNGLQVRQVQSGSMFEKLGLRVGDVIHRINGETVTSLDDVFKAYARLSAQRASRVQVELARGGKTEVLDYNMQ
jgi:general secretion pathway protein C